MHAIERFMNCRVFLSAYLNPVLLVLMDSLSCVLIKYRFIKNEIVDRYGMNVRKFAYFVLVMMDICVEYHVVDDSLLLMHFELLYNKISSRHPIPFVVNNLTFRLRLVFCLNRE